MPQTSWINGVLRLELGAGRVVAGDLDGVVRVADIEDQDAGDAESMLIPGMFESMLGEGDASMVIPGMFGSMLGLAAGLSGCAGDVAGDWQAARASGTVIRATRAARRTITGGVPPVGE